MINILHIVGLAHGGAGKHVLSLAAGCDPKRFRSTVAMADCSPMRGDFEQAGVRVLPLSLDHYGGLRRNVIAYRQIAEIIRREPYDVIQTHTSVAGALGRLAARRNSRAPVVHMIHAFAGHARRAWLTRVVAGVIERRLDRLTDWYIAGSQAMVERGLAQRIFTADKVRLIHNGIDLAPFRSYQANARPTDCEPIEACDAPAVRVGFLGRLEKQKGVPYLIEAAALIKQVNPRIRFLIAGDGSLRARLEHQARRLGVAGMIEFLGWTADVIGFLDQIDILAMPSLWEAFGLSAAEAMALGKPVIASRIEGLPEVVEDGQTGVLVPPGNATALALAIVDLAANAARRRALGQRGLERVAARFALEGMIARHEEFYERLARGGEFQPLEDPAPARPLPAALAAAS